MSAFSSLNAETTIVVTPPGPSSARRPAMRTLLALGLAAILGVVVAGFEPALAGEWTLTNPAKRAYKDEPIRLQLPVPEGPFRLLADGKEVPYQVEEMATPDGKGTREWIWALVDLEPGAAITFTTQAGAPAKTKPRVAVETKDGTITMMNGLETGATGIRLPAAASEGAPPCPVEGVMLPGKGWVGAGRLQTALKLKGMTSTVTGDGTLFGKVRLRYDFEGKGGALGETPAFAEIDVTLLPGRAYAIIEERHAMARGDHWEFDLAHGWDGRKASCRIFGGGAGKRADGSMWPKDLKPLGLDPRAIEERYANGDPRLGDVLMWLVPRWNQHYEDGWFFAVHDDQAAAAALVARAGLWVWPHDNKLSIHAKESADYAGVRAPLWKGARYWLLVAAPYERVSATTVTLPLSESDKKKGKEPRTKTTDNAHALVRHDVWEALDKIEHTYITTWGDAVPDFRGDDFYSSGVNPTGFWRQMGRNAMKNAGKLPKKPSTAMLTHVQVMLDPDMYGSYWDYWSPQNPNFFTDFIKRPLGEAARLRQHPRFAEIAKACELKMREDLYHSVTLPGGAGQECPGYLAHALKAWEKMAPVCKQYLDFDPTTWPRYAAAKSFLWHLSQPRKGGKRVFHPGGDTHNGKDGPKDAAPYKSSAKADDPKGWRSEELPGFGAVLRNRPGTDRETYLAFKSGPNRGHYHGDQLSLHYCAEATPLAVDHRCSYKPRAGQEHMHNRVAFHSDKLPYANMDGYERLIAFKTSPVADIAMGQVESERMRATTKLPPEQWDRDYPRQEFDTPLLYRRTVVLVKGETDYVVLRDQYVGPEVHATWCLHGRNETLEQDGRTLRFEGLTAFVAAPKDFLFENLPFQHDNGGPEITQGARLTIKDAAGGAFVTVLYPSGQKGKLPAMESIPNGVKVGEDTIVFGGAPLGDTAPGADADAKAAYVTVTRAGVEPVTLTGSEIDMERSQGEVGLFVPDAGYPFGPIPAWLIRQRATRPDWAPAAWPPFQP